MNLKSLLDRLPFPGRASSILVCETDGFHLHSAVIRRDGKQLKVEATARSEALEYREAVAELLASLRSQGWRGRHAILLTPAVYSTLLELPVSPKQKRPALQMQELIRWELEPLLVQHNMRWSTGQILLAMGYLDEAQVTEVLDRQQGKHKSGGHGNIYTYKRFGELAMEMGYVTQARIDECLARQAWLQAVGDDISCGWTPQIIQHEDGYGEEDADQSGVYPWLVSGANIGMMRQWEAAFAAGKVTLGEVYPLLGSAVGLLEETDDAILLESHDGFVGGVRVQGSAVAATRLQQSRLSTVTDACLETYHGLVPPEAKKVWLAAGRAEAVELNDTLGRLLGREVHLLPQTGKDGAGKECSAAMLGAARDFFRMSGAGRSSPVSVRGPKPPVWQRAEARAVAAGILLMLIIATLEMSLHIRKDMAQARHTTVATAKKEFDTIVAQAQARVDAVNKAKADIAAKEAEINKLMERFDFFAVELPTRAAFVQNLLNELVNTVGEDVVINAIEETPNLGFRVAGWALSESAAQHFIQSFKSAMAFWNVDVVDPIVRAQAGRLGMMGYDVHFRLVEMQPEPATAAADTQGARR